MDRAEARNRLRWLKARAEMTMDREAIDLAIQALELQDKHIEAVERMIEGAKEINRFLDEATVPKEMTLEEWQELDREIQGGVESATTTEDCISRQAVIDLLLNAQDGSGQTYEVIRELLHEVAYMPPVNQKQITSKLESVENATSEGDESTISQPKSKLDCISRWDLYDEMQWSIEHDMYDKPYDYLVEILEAPSVTPTERTGEWIEDGYYDSPFRVCSHCGYEHPNQQEIWKFCPNCGAKMGERREE